VRDYYKTTVVGGSVFISLPLSLSAFISIAKINKTQATTFNSLKQPLRHDLM